MKKFFITLGFLLLSTLPAWAQYNGPVQCVDCGDSPSSNNIAPSVDYQALQRQQAEQERQRKLKEEQDRIKKEQAAEEKRIKQEQFEADKKETLHDMKGVDVDNDDQLKGADSSEDGTGLKTGDEDSKDGPNDKKTVYPLQHSKDVIHNVVYAGVVDARGARVPMIRQADEIENSPGKEEARKGFQAIADHDWKVALAWYQTALQKDPSNISLQRMVDLCAFTLVKET